MQLRTRRLLAALAIAPVVPLLGCGGDSAGPEQGVSVQDVWTDTDRLEGQEVTLSATVQSLVSERAFVISGGDGGSDPLLVVHDGSAEPDIASPVRVTGTVRQVLAFEALEFLGDPVLQREIYETYGDEPYVEATTITPLPGS